MLQTRARREEQISMLSQWQAEVRPVRRLTSHRIDVLLTLIIMFMLVALDPKYGEKVQVPQVLKDPAAEPAIERTVVIQIVWTTMMRGQR
jgi:hypothetical protein